MAIRELPTNYLMNYEDTGFQPTIEDIIAQISAPIEQTPVVQSPAQTAQSDKNAIIDNLTKQILGSSDSSKWQGGVGSEKAAKDMANIMAGIGITDVNQFGPVTKEVELYMGEGVDGTPIYQKQTEQTFGNKLTGQAVPVTYSERQTGNAFGGTFEGKGNTGYRVDFTPDGKPVFYTTGASSSNAAEIIKPFAQMALLAAGIGGLEALGLGAGGAATGAGATGAGLATAGELGTLAGTAGGTGLSAGASGLGLNAAGAGLGAAGTGAGITAGAGLTGTGVLTGSTLGTGLLGTGLGAAGLTGTGILAGSELGSTLLGTTSTTPLVGTGVLSGSELGSQLLGTGVGSPVIVPPTPPTIIEPVTSIQPSPVSSGTGITANNSGLGINAGTTGLNTIAVDGGLTNTGILTGSSLGTELLGTGLGASGLTGTGVLTASELGKALIGTTSTTPLIGTGVLTGSELGAKLLGTGANTAATVGGVTGLTNAANVGAGALNTGVSTGITGLGSGALNTGINPSGASTIAPPITTPVAPTPTTGLTPSDAIRAASVIATIAGAGNMANSGSGGFAIVPIPADWKSPTYTKDLPSVAPTQLIPIDFGTRELLRGTQWERLLSPDYGQVPAPVQFNQPSNLSYQDLMGILGSKSGMPASSSLSINDVISGIQNQYGQTTNSAMGQKPT